MNIHKSVQHFKIHWKSPFILFSESKLTFVGHEDSYKETPDGRENETTVKQSLNISGKCLMVVYVIYHQ